jgi:hypothetical protein
MRLNPEEIELRVRDLNDTELDEVTGGLVSEAVGGAIKGAIWGGVSARDDGTRPTLPCDSVDILCHILS